MKEKTCLSCTRLGKCTKTSFKLVWELADMSTCTTWEGVDIHILHAREDLLDELGPKMIEAITQEEKRACRTRSCRGSRTQRQKKE
jgi:hypothetical protein